MSTLILRHRRENLSKCSLRGLEKRGDLSFYTYPTDPLPPLANCIVLKVGAPPLTEADAASDLLLIDGTWRLASVMEQQVLTKNPALQFRSLPGNWKTAYPRRQTECPDPSAGLSSVEALFLAYRLLGRPTEGLLDNYYWKEPFLALNGLSLY